MLKIAQRCNLNCTYCYVYNRGDDSWRGRPVFISPAVVSALARRIGEASADSKHDRFVVELHGGEPLLIGKSRLRRLVRQLRDECSGVNVDFHLQTNGLLLDAEWIALFAEEGVRIGVSIDGPPEVADRYRVRHNGSGSTQQILDNIEALRASGSDFDSVFSGALCVVNPDLDGGDLVRWFVSREIRAFDFLLPDGNYVNPPDGWRGPEPYTRFMLSAFDAYYGMGAQAPKIRRVQCDLRPA